MRITTILKKGVKIKLKTWADSDFIEKSGSDLIDECGSTYKIDLSDLERTDWIYYKEPDTYDKIYKDYFKSHLGFTVKRKKELGKRLKALIEKE